MPPTSPKNTIPPAVGVTPLDTASQYGVCLARHHECLVEELLLFEAPRADELVVRKHYYDGFNGTVLDGALRARGVTTLVVTGTMTDICVLATVIGAFNREYRVLVVDDGVSTLWPEIQRATLDIIRRAYARVLSAKELADELARW